MVLDSLEIGLEDAETKPPVIIGLRLHRIAGWNCTLGRHPGPGIRQLYWACSGSVGAAIRRAVASPRVAAVSLSLV